MRTIPLNCALAALGILLAQPLMSCGSSSSSNTGTGGGASGADCKAVCAKSDALMCPMTTQGECAMQCDKNPASCKSQVDAFVACGATAMFMCNADGDATAVGCDKQASDYVMCLLSASGFDGGI